MAQKLSIIDRGYAKEVRVPDLSGGVNIRVSPTLVPADQARSLRNFSLREPGTLTVDFGYTRFTSSSFGSGRAQGGQRVYLKNGVAFTLVAEGGNVKKPSDAGAPGANVLTGLHATNDIFFPYDRDMVGVFDSSNVPKKSVDGTTWTQMGITAPSAAPTAAGVAGGSLLDTNIYEISYTYADDELSAESNTSPILVGNFTASAPNLTARVTVTNSGDAQVDRKNIYVRNVTTGEAVRRKVGTTTGTTFDIDGPDSDWAQGAEVPTTHDVPPALSFGVPWKNRWWARDAVVKNRIRFTEIFQPQSWPGLYFIDVPLELGDDCTAIIPLGDTLLIFGQSGLFLIFGQTSLDFEVRPSLGVESGAVGPNAVTKIENGVIHGSSRGVHLWDGASDRLLSFDISPGWEDVISGSSAADISRIAIVYHGERKEVRIAVPRLFPTGSAGEWIIDLDRSRTAKREVWESTNRPVGGYIYWNGAEATTGNRGRLFSWASNEAHLYEESTGTDANGADLVAEYESAAFALGFVMARWIAVYGEYRPADGLFGIEAVVDGVSQGSQTISTTASQARYGTAVYGTDRYGGIERAMFSIMLPLEAEGRAFTLKARYTGRAQFQFYTYALEVVPEPLPRGIS
jgi:hypothetical protein